MNPQYTIATNQYGHYCIPLSSAHRPCAKRILAGEVHEPDTIQYILDNCGDGDVIHAGAYFGDMLPVLSGGTVKVFAFEPSPDNFTCALITRLLNDLSNVHLFDRALSNEHNGKALIKIGDSKGKVLGGGSRIRSFTFIKDDRYSIIDNRYKEVNLVRLDFLLEDFTYKDISIIHLDIEGSEQLALAGAMDTITRCKPILILETLPSDEWIDRNLAELGYKITGKVHSNSILECVK